MTITSRMRHAFCTQSLLTISVPSIFLAMVAVDMRNVNSDMMSENIYRRVGSFLTTYRHVKGHSVSQN